MLDAEGSSSDYDLNTGSTIPLPTESIMGFSRAITRLAALGFGDAELMARAPKSALSPALHDLAKIEGLLRYVKARPQFAAELRSEHAAKCKISSAPAYLTAARSPIRAARPQTARAEQFPALTAPQSRPRITARAQALALARPHKKRAAGAPISLADPKRQPMKCSAICVNGFRGMDKSKPFPPDISDALWL